jgi:hypothetical protein
MEIKIKELQERLKETEEQLGQETLRRRAAEESLGQSRETLKSECIEKLYPGILD